MSCPGSIESLCKNIILSCCHLKDYGWITLLMAATKPSVPQYVFCLRLLFKAELPRVLLLSSVVFLVWPLPPFSFFSGLWTSSVLDSCFHLRLCFGQGKNSANENRKNKKTRRVVSALHVSQRPGSPLWGLSILWVVDRKDCGWRLTPSDQKLSRRPFFSHLRINKYRNDVERSWTVLYFMFTHPLHTLKYLFSIWFGQIYTIVNIAWLQ